MRCDKTNSRRKRIKLEVYSLCALFNQFDNDKKRGISCFVFGVTHLKSVKSEASIRISFFFLHHRRKHPIRRILEFQSVEHFEMDPKPFFSFEITPWSETKHPQKWNSKETDWEHVRGTEAKKNGTEKTNFVVLQNDSI